MFSQIVDSQPQAQIPDTYVSQPIPVYIPESYVSSSQSAASGATAGRNAGKQEGLLAVIRLASQIILFKCFLSTIM